MKYFDWLRHRTSDVQVNGLGGVRRGIHDVYEHLSRRAWLGIGPDYGTSVYQRDWDVLVILDACPYKLATEVQSEYDVLQSMEEFESVGTGTRGWMTNTFLDADEEYRDEIGRTTYINANPNSDDLLDASDFETLDEVWQYGYDEELYVTPPRVVTDRLIETLRNDEGSDRVIAHYMQPHAPFLQNMELTEYTGDGYERSIWRAILRGRADPETVWNAYRDNLRYVLDEIELLLENIDAEEVVITSDHGNAMGEWGIYGHGGPPIEPLVKVPWIPVGKTTDERTHEPASQKETGVDPDTEQQLEQLGYMT